MTRRGVTAWVTPDGLRNRRHRGARDQRERTDARRRHAGPDRPRLRAGRDGQRAPVSRRPRRTRAGRTGPGEVPGGAALLTLLRMGGCGARGIRWFVKVPLDAPGLHPRYRWSARRPALGEPGGRTSTAAACARARGRAGARHALDGRHAGGREDPLPLHVRELGGGALPDRRPTRHRPHWRAVRRHRRTAHPRPTRRDPDRRGPGRQPLRLGRGRLRRARMSGSRRRRRHPRVPGSPRGDPAGRRLAGARAPTLGPPRHVDAPDGPPDPPQRVHGRRGPRAAIVAADARSNTSGGGPISRTSGASRS